jgi:hypothetical protein
MFEGKVKKIPFLSIHDDVEPLFDGGSGKAACDGIGCKCPRVASEQVARKLIQNDYDCENRPWLGYAEAVMRHEPLVQRQKAIADLRVNVVASREPMSLSHLFEPEVDDVADPRRFGIFSFRVGVARHSGKPAKARV